jgi:membrane-associated protease RseP (regulator of RpoE activity)
VTDTYSKMRNEVLSGGADSSPEDVPVGGRRAMIGLGVIVALLVLLGFYSGFALLFVVGLLVSIFLHELGHFSTARWTGMKATQFFLFMGPKLWSFRRGETEYGVRAYPLGAFVRIIGMSNIDEVDPADEPRAYRNKSYPRRLLVITAGSIMHILIAIALLFGVYAINGKRVESGRVGFSAVAAGYPADDAGVEPGDVVVSIDGVPASSVDGVIGSITAHQPGDEIELVVQRDGELVTLTPVLTANPNEGPNEGKAYLGISVGDEMAWSQSSLLTAAGDSVSDLGEIMSQSVGGLFKVLNPVNLWNHLTGETTDPTTQPSTVVGITRATKTIGAEAGMSGVFLMLAGVNVFVGLFNMVPLLPLDGGHAAVATYERIRSRKGRPYHADITKLIPLTVAAVTLLAMLLFTGLYLDFTRPPL